MTIIDLTLFQQMQLSDHEIEVRKRLFDFTDDDANHLKSCHEIISNNIDRIVDHFYSKQIEIPEIVLVIGDKDTLLKLRQSMRIYILELFGGYYDADYVNKRLRVGKIHKRIGVTPKLYMSAIRLLYTTLEEFIINEMHVSQHCDDYYNALRNSLLKIILFDTQLIFDTYINSLMSEVESAKREIEIYANGLEEKIAQRTNELKEAAIRDPLTNLFNQRAFYDNLWREIALADRRMSILSLVYLDLNNFKRLNDECGHKAGDEALVKVGNVLQSIMRKTDYCCRYGGDEFCIVMPETIAIDAEKLCQRLITAFDIGETSGISFSIGIVTREAGSTINANDLVRAADAQMYEAKSLSKINSGHHISMSHLNG